MPEQPLFDRKIPALTLLAMTAVLALHHWYAVTDGNVSFFVLFLVPPIWMLALGGLVHPPLLYSIGKYRHGLPVATKGRESRSAYLGSA